MKKVFLFGLSLFVIVYSGFAVNNTAWVVYVLFALYGIYAASTEGIAKAWITNIAHEKNTATALGYYTSLQSVAAFLSSSVAGIIWYSAGSEAVFLFAASLAVIAIGYLGWQKTVSHPEKKSG